MIQVTVTTHEDRIQEIRVTGHANSNAYGRDLVCAAVSAVMFGACNALYELTKNGKAEVKDNEIVIGAKRKCNTVQTILKVTLIQLETIQEKNKAYLRIEKKEV